MVREEEGRRVLGTLGPLDHKSETSLGHTAHSGHAE